MRTPWVMGIGIGLALTTGWATQGALFVAPHAITRVTFTRPCQSQPDGSALCDGVRIEFDQISVTRPSPEEGEAPRVKIVVDKHAR